MSTCHKQIIEAFHRINKVSLKKTDNTLFKCEAKCEAQRASVKIFNLNRNFHKLKRIRHAPINILIT